jgi:hypothetical protein
MSDLPPQSPPPDSLARVPLVILAGSDGRAGPTPANAADRHFIVGYKGASLRFAGRPLILELIDRVRAAGDFDPVVVAGPRRVYAPIVDGPIVDTDGTVGENVFRGIEEVRRLCGPDTRVAIMACDILPTSREIHALAIELIAPDPVSGEVPALAISLCAVGNSQAALGSSDWKPRYRIRRDASSEPEPFLPGHLAVAWPEQLRTRLFDRLLRLAYAERNRDFDHRRRAIVSRVLGALLWRDILNIFRGQFPLLTVGVLRHGLVAFRRWRRGELDVAGVARALEGMTVHRRVQRASTVCSVRVVLSPMLSFAKDIDTEEELAEIERDSSDQTTFPTTRSTTSGK